MTRRSPPEYTVSTAGAITRGGLDHTKENREFLASFGGTLLAFSPAGSMGTVRRKGHVNRIRTATSALLLASFVGLQPALVDAQGRGRGHDKDRRGRYEDRWDRRDDRRYQQGYREGYWDAARYYRRDDRRYRPRRLGRNDNIYRGSDNRYYCRRDDGTTGLIIGGIGGGVLGHVIAPGGAKTLGTIIGAGAGALLGRAIDDGDIVCH